MKCTVGLLLVWCSVAPAALAATTGTSKAATTFTSKATTVLTSKATTTVVSPTKTYCPQFYTTRKSPLPTDYTCGVRGTLAQRDEISRHCYDRIYDETVDETDCYRSCSNEPRCISYAWDLYEEICYLYAKPLIDMGFRRDSNSSQSHWNLRGCHVCQADPLPAKPGCPESETPKPEKDTAGYFCNALGYTTQNYTAYISHSISTYFEEYCYPLCRKFDAFGACEALIIDRTGRYTSCTLITKPLREIGWTRTNEAPPYQFGTNLRGCYNCTLPPTKTYSNRCVPTPQPVAPVLKNAEFSNTVFDSYHNTTVPQDWQVSGAGYVSAVRGASGNTYVSFGVEYDFSDYIPFIYQDAANFSRNPYLDTRFYNVTFDLALARLNRTGVTSCVMGANYWTNVTIDLTKFKVGQTFQKMGPYLWDASVINSYPIFSVNCSTGRGKLELWLDNVQITQRGRLVAGAGTGQ